MNIQGYGTGSFADIMNSSHKRNNIPLVNQIVSYKDKETNEIYRAFFTDNKVTAHNAVGQTVWETSMKDASHAKQIKESLSGITLYSQDSITRKKALSSVGFPNGESISIFEADDFSKENPIYTVKHWDENGVENEYTIDPRNVNPESASYLEMAAYATYLDTTGQTQDAFGDFVGASGGINQDAIYNSTNMNSKEDFLAIIYDYMQMQYDANNLKGYLSIKSLYDCMTGGKLLDADVYRESLRSGNHSAIRESGSSDNGRAIGVTMVGNIGYVARYADSSTPDNPVIKIGDYEVLVNEVDPHNATQLEMFALLSYLDDINQTNNTGMSSFSKLRSYAELAEMNGFCEGIQDVNGFFDTNQNWEEIMRAIKEVFLGNPQTYEHAMNCDMLMNIMSGDEKF